MKKGINDLVVNSGEIARRFDGSVYRSALIMSSENIFIENDVPNVGIDRLDLIDLEDNMFMVDIYKRIAGGILLIELSNVSEEEIDSNEELLTLINSVDLVIWNNIVLKDMRNIKTVYNL